jgi:hypothetical protein
MQLALAAENPSQCIAPRMNDTVGADATAALIRKEVSTAVKDALQKHWLTTFRRLSWAVVMTAMTIAVVYASWRMCDTLNLQMQNGGCGGATDGVGNAIASVFFGFAYLSLEW